MSQLLMIIMIFAQGICSVYTNWSFTEPARIDTTRRQNRTTTQRITEKLTSSDTVKEVFLQLLHQKASYSIMPSPAAKSSSWSSFWRCVKNCSPTVHFEERVGPSSWLICNICLYSCISSRLECLQLLIYPPGPTNGTVWFIVLNQCTCRGMCKLQLHQIVCSSNAIHKYNTTRYGVWLDDTS